METWIGKFVVENEAKQAVHVYGIKKLVEKKELPCVIAWKFHNSFRPLTDTDNGSLG